MEIVWLRSAVNDLECLQAFIIDKNPKAARNVAQKIKRSVDNLSAHPEIGKPVEDLLPFRDLNIPFGARGYVLRYRIHNEQIYIVHLRHFRENDFH